MTAFWSNILLLAVATVSLGVLAVALLWRVSAWYVSAADALINDEGLPIGAAADEIAAYNASGEFHLTFGRERTFLVFGATECRPCRELLRVAPAHPAISPLRKVFVSDDDLDPSEENVHEWETYVLADSWHTRRQWRAPASPYFYLIDVDGRIAAKGIANTSAHLDRLLLVPPPTSSRSLTTLPSRQLDPEGVGT